MSRAFSITQRHYDILLKQVRVNLPQESGGFLGGKDDVIMAILPVFNQHLFNKTDTYGITSEDFERAHLFFKKHNLDYFGVYHSHPTGVAYPSAADINTGQKYHFIFGLSDPENPVFFAYEIISAVPHQIPIRIVKDNAFKAIDINGRLNSGESDPQKTIFDTADELKTKIEDIQNRRAKYPKLKPKSGFDSSDFSTLA
jgi:proteasome lid subunit RPN8/RPN11